MNENAWIDPNLLQLVGLGTRGDPYLPDGRHLRWFPGRILGFPRTGFRLLRRPSPTPWNARKLEVLPSFRAQSLGQTALSAGWSVRGGRRFSSGLFVPMEGVSWISLGASGTFPRLGSFSVHFTHEGLGATPPTGPRASNPAAWVAVTIAARSSSGRATAIALATVDEGREEVCRADGTTGPLAGPAPGWSSAVLLLHGGLIDEVELQGHDAIVTNVEWIPSRAWASEEQGWEVVDRYLLPIVDEPAIYPAWAPGHGEAVARARLDLARPRALPPWLEASHPPPPASHGAMEAELVPRYLGRSFFQLHAVLRELLARELVEVRPQVRITRTETLEAEAGTPSSATGTRVTIGLLDQILLGALDPGNARVLGLMTTDYAAPEGAWDYLVETDLPQLWLLAGLLPDLTEPLLEQIRAKLHGHLLSWRSLAGHDTTFDAFGPVPADLLVRLAELGPLGAQARIVSLATRISQHPVPLPRAPEALTGRTVARPGFEPPAAAWLSWKLGRSSPLVDPLGVHVAYAARRSGPDGDRPLHDRDPENGRFRPILPAASDAHVPRARIRDRWLKTVGTYQYRLSAMDLFGRFSPYAAVELAVVDTVPPPAPTLVDAALVGEGPTWDALTIRLDWGPEQAAMAPDLDHLEVYVRQGRVGTSEAGLAASWGGVETMPGSVGLPVQVSATLLNGALPAEVSLPDGSTVYLEAWPPAGWPASETARTRLTVRILSMNVPFTSGEAWVSVSAAAFDASGNQSAFAPHVLALRHEPVPLPEPAMPGGISWASYPDARARSFRALPLGTDLPSGASAQVYRADEAVLLSKATETEKATWAGADQDGRAELLRSLSLANPGCFTPDHPYPYAAGTPTHRAELNGNDRGWTVYTVVAVGPTGVRASWPTSSASFAVVAIPRAPSPPVPLVQSVQPGDRSVRITIAGDPTGRTTTFRVWRARSEEGQDPELRRMRPIASLSAPATAADTVELVDTELEPDRTWLYRVTGDGASGQRSPPTSAIRTRPWSSLPPTAPELLGIERPNAGTLRVTIKVARLDYAMELFRRPPGVRSWQRIGGSKLDPNALAPAVDGEGWRLTFEEPVSEPTGRYRYFARLTDPRGRSADSAALEEAP